MVGANLWIFLGVISLFHIAGNILLTRQLAECIPVVKERLPLLIILWFIPVAGAFYTFRKIGTDFYEPAQPGNTGVTADVMGMGEFFNPNARTEQVIEEKLPPAFTTSANNDEMK